MASRNRLSDPSLFLSLGVNINDRAFFFLSSTIISQVFDRSDHQLVAATVEKVMKQADEYIRAIHMSLVTAEMGCEFADNAIELCKFLAKGEAHVEHLQTSLGEMLVKANTAHAQALAMNQQFAGVRSALFQVSSVVYGEYQIVTSSTRSQTHLSMRKR